MPEKYYLTTNESLLLIIDLQDKLMNAMSEKEGVYKNTRLLLTAANQYRLPVVVTEQYPKGLGPTAVEIAEALEEHQLVEKNAFDACTEDTNRILREHGRKQIIVCGSETHICVYQTVRHLLDLGYQVFVTADAVCSRFKANYKNGLQLMAEMGAVIITAEGIVFDWMKVSGTPEFKVISPLLK